MNPATRAAQSLRSPAGRGSGRGKAGQTASGTRELAKTREAGYDLQTEKASI
jgi:hypothetical protein